MLENIRLKRELLLKKPVQHEERELKLPGSMGSLSAISEEHPTSQTSISNDNQLIKDSVLQTIDRIREGLSKLNSLKENQIDLLKNSQARYDYLQL